MNWKPLSVMLGLAMGIAFLPQPAHSQSLRYRSSANPLGYEVRADRESDESVGAIVSAREAVVDSFYIYGGPGTLEGKFQTPTGAPDWQGWISVDRTQIPSFWHISTFNASSFTGPTPNHAFWCGVDSGPPFYSTPPGYGNNWDQRVVFERAVGATQAHDVRLRFEFHHDLEPGYDYFLVEYDSAGSWMELARFDGTNDDGSGTFPTPVGFDQTISFAPGDYSGDASDQVRLRLRVLTDPVYSDEDGIWDSVAGAVQVDNVVVSIDGIVVSEATFEGGPGDADWTPGLAPFAGDFAKVIPALRDLDECRQDELDPAVNFVDDGTPPSNAPQVSTGGSISANWTYGHRGYVVNGQGGITFGGIGIQNEVWSPEILWDDPTTDADDGLGATVLRFDVYRHLPFANGIYWVWHVRSKQADSPWGPWRDREYVYFSLPPGFPEWVTKDLDVTDLVGANPERVQVALGVWDLSSVIGTPGDDATPSPYYDDVRVLRRAVAGPRLVFHRAGFHDGFPPSGASDFATERAQMSVRIDPSYDAYDPGVVNGDSLIVRAVSLVEGVGLAGPPMMTFRLFANPVFDDLRGVPPLAEVVGVVDGRTVYEGTVTGAPWPSAAEWQGELYGLDIPGDGPGRLGTPFPDPDEEPFFWPGDWLHYYVEVADDVGNVARLPGDITGFERPGAFDRRYTIRALPSFDAQGQQPPLLVVTDRGSLESLPSILIALDQNGLVEGVGYDLYAYGGGDLGNGGARGATAAQLAGYDTVLYLRNFIDPSTVELFSQWHGVPGDRALIYFGDDLITDFYLDGSLAYVINVMRVEPVAVSAQPSIGDQGTVAVAPTGAPPTTGLFTTEFLSWGQCPYLIIADFDWVRPIPPAVSAFEFLGPGGETGLYDASAGIWYERLQDIDGTAYRRIDAYFPYIFDGVVDARAKAGAGASARARLLGEVLEAVGTPVNDGGATAVEPRTARLAVHQNLPNPFNPSTTIRFELPRSGPAKLEVYDTAGRRVATLVEGELEAGPHEVTWSGQDGRGRRVASGVYLYRLVTGDGTLTRRMVLLK